VEGERSEVSASPGPLGYQSIRGPPPLHLDPTHLGPSPADQVIICLGVFHVFTSSVLLVKGAYWQVRQGAARGRMGLGAWGSAMPDLACRPAGHGAVAHCAAGALQFLAVLQVQVG
jgi:hypothetical protein